MKIFKDRISAGKLLADKLKGVEADLVLGIPRGGVVVAAEIAQGLKIPLDILVTRKIGVPTQPELAIGAVDPDGEVVWDKELVSQVIIPPEALKLVIRKEWKELKRREDLYRAGKDPYFFGGKTVILVDDGMATGETVLSAINYLLRRRAKIILAVPLCSKEALKKVINKVENAEILEVPVPFGSVGQYFEKFEPVTDEEVVKLLE